MGITTIYDDSTNKIAEWDFEKNVEIDILNEDTNSVKKASWICSNCGLHYDYEIKTHTTYKCPNCGMSRLTREIHNYNNIKRNLYIKSIVFLLIGSIILNLIVYGVNYKFVNITKDVVLSILFSVLAFIQIATFIWSIDQNKMLNSTDYITKSRLLYNLINRGDDYETLKYYYENTIINRLLYLCKNNQLTKDIDIFLQAIMSPKNRKLVCEWFNIKDKTEVLFLIKNLKTAYFDKLYSRFETKNMIDFRYSNNLWKHIATPGSGIISLLLSMVLDINDWNFVEKKLFVIILLFVMYILYIATSYKKRLQMQLSGIMNDTIYVSSAIAKKSRIKYYSPTGKVGLLLI